MMMLFHIKIAHIVKIFPLSSKPSDFCFDSLFVLGGILIVRTQAWGEGGVIKMHVDACMEEGGSRLFVRTDLVHCTGSSLILILLFCYSKCN